LLLQLFSLFQAINNNLLNSHLTPVKCPNKTKKSCPNICGPAYFVNKDTNATFDDALYLKGCFLNLLKSTLQTFDITLVVLAHCFCIQCLAHNQLDQKIKVGKSLLRDANRSRSISQVGQIILKRKQGGVSQKVSLMDSPLCVRRLVKIENRSKYNHITSPFPRITIAF